MAGPHVGSARAERSEVKKGGETHMLTRIYCYIVTMVRAREEGQGMAEYALILVLVALAAILAFTALGSNISTIVNAIKDKLVIT
jgi:pilus assembly protein Flp/PilA